MKAMQILAGVFFAGAMVVVWFHPPSFLTAVACGLLCLVLDQLYRLPAILGRSGWTPVSPREEPAIVAHGPTLSEVAARNMAAPVPPPLPGKRTRAKQPSPEFVVLFFFVLGPLVVLAVILVAGTAFTFARGEKKPPAAASEPAWSDAEHDATLRKLAAAMSREGFVWRSETEGDEDPRDNPRAMEGKGEIVNLVWPRLKWRLVETGAKDQIDRPIRPEIQLALEVEGHLPGDVLAREFPGEIGRFDAQLPAGAKETFARLAEYAQQLYDEDHVGTPEEPGRRKGTASIATRRKAGPQVYDLAVVDRVVAYQAEVTILERAEPHRQIVKMSLRRP